MAFPEGLRPGAPRGVLPCEPDPADEALKVTRTLERNFRKLYTHSLGLSFRVMDLFIGTWIGFLGLSRELIRPICLSLTYSTTVHHYVMYSRAPGVAPSLSGNSSCLWLELVLAADW